MYSSNSIEPNIAKYYPPVNSVSLIARQCGLPDDRAMLKSVADIRREKLSLEVAKEGGAVKFADKYDENPDYIRQIVNGKAHGGVNIGARAARKFEQKLGKPPNWLDHPGEVPEGVHSENDVIALQIAVTALVKALAENIRGAGPDFAAHVKAQARVDHFSIGHALLANLLGIAQPDQNKVEAASPVVPHRGSVAGTKR